MAKRGNTVLTLLIGGGGAAAAAHWLGGPWALAWVGLCAAFVLVARQLWIPDAIRVFVIALGAVAVLLGGGVLLARRYGEPAAWVWIGTLAVLYPVVLPRLLRRASPLLRVADEMDRIVSEAMDEEKRRGRG